MKTIKLITEAIDLMKTIGLPANMQIGSFEIISNGSYTNWCGKTGEYLSSTIKFNIIFRPDHIQMLKNMGVNIDLENCKMHGLSETALRFKRGREAIKQGRYAPYYYGGNPNNNQTGVIENWLIAPATCSIESLQQLDLICRENHRAEISIHNDHTLITAGFKKDTEIQVSDSQQVKEHLARVAEIRKSARRLFSEKKIKFLSANYKIK